MTCWLISTLSKQDTSHVVDLCCILGTESSRKSLNRDTVDCRIQTVKLKIPGKGRIQKFCYIQVIVFDLSYLLVEAVGT